MSVSNLSFKKGDFERFQSPLHAPSKKSIMPPFDRDILSAAYASNLDDFVAKSGAQLWIHGHTHTQFDYTIDATRVICNPRGYPDEPNERFNPQLVVEI
ncbi:MAG: hypothetical protein MUE44_24895 [Oscillatoriaceae cyanobacterium Prado104]|nr:hypothetical protein [Oscillatoriaceae cyanobacterium Prado104]